MIKFTPKIKKLLLTCNIGIEKESHRVDKDGFLAKTPHPFPNDKIIKMDFAESQTEIATTACSTPEKVYEELFWATKIIKQKISENGEILWALSNPPLFTDEKSIKVAQFPNDYEETKFREYLAQKYGKKVMLYSGIHYNFSFSDELLYELYETSQETNFKIFKDKIYLKIAKYSFLYSWFLVYCSAASPVFHPKFLPQKNKKDQFGFISYASMRNSPYGYKNEKKLYPDFSSAKDYVWSIREMIKSDSIRHESELYSPVRIKARKGHSLKSMEKDGLDFIELRMFDLNPFDSAGFSLCDIKFIQLFIVYILSLPDFNFTKDIQSESYNNIFCGALLNPKKEFISRANIIFNKMVSFFELLNFTNSVDIIKQVYDRTHSPETRYANKLYELHKKHDYVELGLKLSAESEITV